MDKFNNSKREKKYNHNFHMNMIYFSSIGYNHNYDYKNFSSFSTKFKNIKNNKINLNNIKNPF